MIKSLHAIMIFFWGYILFVRVQCRGTLGILNESKLSEHKELCFRRCDIVFQADDKGISSKKIFGRRSCYERCLREDVDMNSAKNELRAFADEQKMSFLKRIRRDALKVAGKPNPGIMYGKENCSNGSAESNSNATVVGSLGIVFDEVEDTGRYQGTVTWKPLQNVSGNWTGYKIITLYKLPNWSDIVECHVVDKNVTQYNISNSFHGIENGSHVSVLVVSSPHLNNLDEEFSNKQLSCHIPDDVIDGCVKLAEEATSPSSAEEATSPSSDNGTSLALISALVTSCVFAIALLLVALHYRRRKMYRSNSLANPLTDLKFEFDAFIIYSSHDSEWVVKTLLPTLEEKHGLKCCVHYIDFTLGIPIRQNMVDSVYKCKKTVAIVSTNFFNSNYCGSELDYALHRLMEKKDDSLVVIKLDDVGRNKLPKELQNRSYIDYPKSIEKEIWEKKLIKCLKSTANS